MPESSRWHEPIRKRLAGLALPPAREAEIVEELAEHLEDEYEIAVAGGAGEAEAREQALADLRESRLAEELVEVEKYAIPEPVVPGKPGGGNFIGRLVAGSALRLAHVPEKSRLHGAGGTVPGARHRRERGDFQHCQCGAHTTPALPRGGKAGASRQFGLLSAGRAGRAATTEPDDGGGGLQPGHRV